MDHNLQRIHFLETDVYDQMRNANGSCTWRMLADGMDNIINHEIIRKYIISILDFTYRTNRIYPVLDDQVKVRGVARYKVFWVLQ